MRTVVSLINPATGLPLRFEADALVDDAGNRFAIGNGIPRICDPENYSESFGLQWNRFAETQLQRQGDRVLPRGKTDVERTVDG
jgi:hypothetical protein